MKKILSLILIAFLLSSSLALADNNLLRQIARKKAAGGGPACTPGNIGDNSAADPSSANTTQYRIYIRQFAALVTGEGCVLQNLYCRVNGVDNSGREIKFLIYSDTGSDEPDSLLNTPTTCSGDGDCYWSSTGGSMNWQSQDISGDDITPVDSTKYWVGFVAENNFDATSISREVTGGATKTFDDSDFTPPATWDTETDSDSEWAIDCYANFE